MRQSIQTRQVESCGTITVVADDSGGNGGTDDPGSGDPGGEDPGDPVQPPEDGGGLSRRQLGVLGLVGAGAAAIALRDREG